MGKFCDTEFQIILRNFVNSVQHTEYTELTRTYGIPCGWYSVDTALRSQIFDRLRVKNFLKKELFSSLCGDRPNGKGPNLLCR
jgi:hypothetical protein